MYDVLIIGGGVCGTAIARTLSRYALRVALLEAQPDVAMGATKANSAIVHGGYAEANSKLKGRLCYQGRRQFAALDKELNFGFAETGSMVLAFEETQLPKLKELLENGKKNGLDDLAILGREEIIAREPNVNPEVRYALYCKGAGVCSPYELAIAFAENAVHNGAALFLNSQVTTITKTEEGFAVGTRSGARYQSRYVVNAAGLHSGQISEMSGAGGFAVHPRSGQYILLNRGSGGLVNSVLFQMPTQMGKGILVAPTVYGNLLLGPDALDESNESRDTTPQRLHSIYKQALQTAPGVDIGRFLRSFAGVRPVANTDDFIVRQSPVQGFIDVAGIQSPGLTSSPAIAAMVRDLLADAGLDLREKEDFDPCRQPVYMPYPGLTPGQLAPLLALPGGAPGRMLCRCEQVQEQTLQTALGRGIPVTTADAVKRRTRAGMGWCQGQFCRPRTAELFERLYLDFDQKTDVERDGLARVGRDEMLAYCKREETV